jgi:hypothetical protein
MYRVSPIATANIGKQQKPRSLRVGIRALGDRLSGAKTFKTSSDARCVLLIIDYINNDELNKYFISFFILFFIYFFHFGISMYRLSPIATA